VYGPGFEICGAGTNLASCGLTPFPSFFMHHLDGTDECKKPNATPVIYDHLQKKFSLQE